MNSISINYDGDTAILTLIKDITDSKKMELDLKESLKNLEDLKMALDESSIIAITDQKGIIESVNDKFCEISKYSKEELIGQDHRILNSGYHSKEFFKEMWKTISSGNTWRGEVKNRAKDGSFYWVHTTIVPFLNEKGKPYQYVAIRTDITERKQAEEALVQSEEKYRLIAENMSDLLSVLDMNGQLTYISPSHEMILGYPISYYENNSGFDFIHFEDLPKIESNFQLMLEKKQGSTVECRFKHKNGSWIWFESTCSPILDDNGDILHFIIVSRRITERKMYEEKLTHLAFHDTLTGLPNRRLFTDRLEQSIKEAERYGRNMAVMYMDMDKFKHINDTLGHDIGDELLKQFAQRVKGCLRESDTLARQGGDEFTILLPVVQGEQDILLIANRIFESLQEPWKIGEHVFRTTSSIGIAFYPTDGITSGELMKHADIALYEAKKDGRNNFKTYSTLNPKRRYLPKLEKDPF